MTYLKQFTAFFEYCSELLAENLTRLAVILPLMLLPIVGIIFFLLILVSV